jgi:hypothetical protein
MTGRQRFVDTMTLKPVDRVPFMEIALWGQTIERWIGEGAPPDLDGSFMKGNDLFGLEGYDTVDIDAINPYPGFEERILEEDGDHVTHVDRLGRTRIARKSGTARGTRMSMDQYLGWAVTDRASFHALRHRYEGDPAERYPADWDAVAARLRATDKPVTLLDPLSGTFGYYSMLRNWIGTEPLSYLFYDDPGLVHECLDLLTDFIIRVLTPAVTAVPFDFYFVHEDMAGKGGPLMGPNLFREFLLPHYRTFIGFLKSHGVRLVLVDTDGDFEALLPVFLEAGVDGFGPMEVASGMRPARMRRDHGRSFSMMGGVDKREIAKGRAAIDAEIRCLAEVVRDGGYIPTIDHSVPPDVSLECFRYYLQEKRRVLFAGT